jgi:hypothetical protein
MVERVSRRRKKLTIGIVSARKAFRDPGVLATVHSNASMEDIALKRLGEEPSVPKNNLQPIKVQITCASVSDFSLVQIARRLTKIAETNGGVIMEEHAYLRKTRTFRPISHVAVNLAMGGLSARQ